MANEEIDHIAELQQRLYTRDPENIPKRKFGILRPVKQNTTSTWGETALPKEERVHHVTSSGYKRFFLFALFFFIAALGVALFSFYRGATTLSSKNVDLVILGNSFIGGGEELPIQVEIVNKNAAALENATLVINYPKGATDETGTDVVRIERPLGSVASGKTKSEEFIAILYGEQGISREIKAVLTYQLAGSSASFQKENTFSVMVSSSPVGLTVDTPTAVVSNQPFTLTIKNMFSGDKLLNNVVTRVEYPNGFVFQSATPSPISGNNVWNLGDLQKGDERTIAIVGRLIGEISDEKAFRIYVGTPENETSSKIAVAYNSILSTMTIIQPFIAGTISVGGKTDDTIALTMGQNVSGKINWVNNSGQRVSNPTFTLSLEGSTIDTASIVAPDSYYNQLDRTITWTPDSNSALTSIAPGDRGEFPFTFEVIPSENGESRDIVLGLSISGSFPDQGGIAQEINTIDQKTIRFASNLQFAAQGLYSIGPIKNSGPYPPRADIETTYTLNWTMLPTDNALTNATASAVLPSGVTWAGVIVPASENLTYNADSRTVTWMIGPLPKITATPKNRSVSFQVKARPTKTQVGSPLFLLGETTITATDTVAGVPITATRGSVTTKFDTDPAYTTGTDRVLP
ncbi:MAG: hypothetical protein KBB91_01315 [Candidatus Pacebacteria bacterium]|nr:hypothetical protein [Candidatus Paceibacterota bacterium]MBP9701244.1 hypothetical protein [Candidatus Paceibacterota bacterium]